MWLIILLAIGLLLIIEGIVPLISPKHCRKMMAAMTKISDKPLRIMGLVAVIIGILIFYLVYISMM